MLGLLKGYMAFEGNATGYNKQNSNLYYVDVNILLYNPVLLDIEQNIKNVCILTAKHKN